LKHDPWDAVAHVARLLIAKSNVAYMLQGSRKLRKSLMFREAGNRSRTGDLLITSQLLYQLSYAGL
jgi:hypothetical protein